MVWDASPQGGFTTGRPWLPVKAPQLARNVAGQTGKPDSVLEFYRAMIAFRKASPALSAGGSVFHDAPDPVLAFSRISEKGALLCVFNLSPRAVSVKVRGVGAVTGPGQGAVLTGETLALGPNAAAFLTVTGEVGLW